MRQLAIALFIVGTTACQGAAPERYQSPDDGFSIHVLDGEWTSFRDKGALVFRGPAESSQAQTTIAIRTVALEGGHTASEVVDATAKVLAALPQAEISRQARIDHDRFDATAFEVYFTPKSKQAPYERRHVVLTSHARTVYHVMLTAPAGELAQSVELFDDVVGSLKGEG